MNYTAMAFWFSVIQFICNVLLGIYVIVSNRQKVTVARFTKLEDRMTKVESAVKSMPVCSNHERMERNDREFLAKLESIDRGVSKIGGRLDGINRIVDLLTQNELTGGGKGQ